MQLAVSCIGWLDSVSILSSWWLKTVDGSELPVIVNDTEMPWSLVCSGHRISWLSFES